MRTNDDVETIRRDGFLIIPDLLDSAELAELRRGLEPELARKLHGRNNFEGYLTERVYTLVARGAPFERLAEHPRIVAICDALLEPSYLLTASQAIRIHPGETPQPWHVDDGFYRIPRPRPAVSVSTIVAIDEFRVDNGATEIVAGSHLWDDAAIEEQLARLATDFATPSQQRIPKPAERLPAAFRGRVTPVVMPPGGCIVFLGTLLHRGGENRSKQPRLAISNQYCQPWARPQESFLLGVPQERAAAMSARLQSMLGYSIHPPFMGHVGGLHPGRLLSEGDGSGAPPACAADGEGPGRHSQRSWRAR